MTYPYVVRKILSHYPHIDPTDISRRLRHSSFVDVSKRYLYFEVPKAACTQMKELLRLQHGAPPIQLFVGNLMETRREMFVHARENVPLPSLVDLDEATQKEVLESDSFFRFTIVRDPYTRLVSAWKNKVVPCEPGAERLYLEIKGRLPDMHTKELIAFDEFVGYLQAKGDLTAFDPHWRRQVDHLFFDALSFSHVGKVEDMSAIMARFQQHLGLAEPLIGGQEKCLRASRPRHLQPESGRQGLFAISGRFRPAGLWPRFLARRPVRRPGDAEGRHPRGKIL